MNATPPRDAAGSGWSEAHCYAALRQARWTSGMTCPLCGAARITTHTAGTTAPRRRYLCLGCRRTFSDLTGTPFTRTNLPLRTWFLYLRLEAQGSSTASLAKELGVKWDTIAHMRRRLSAWPPSAPWLAHLQEAVMRRSGDG